MKKNIKYLIILLTAFFFSISSCFALEMTLDELGEKIGSKSEEYYAFVIGKYVFTGDHLVSLKDIMLAARTIDVNDQDGWSSEDDIFDEMTIHRLNATFDENYEITGYEIANNVLGTKQLNPDSINVDYIITSGGNYKVEDIEVAKHHVKFMDGKTELDDVEVNDGAKVEDPGQLEEKANYKFMGWYEDDEFNTEFDFNTNITEDTFVYALYLPMVDINSILTARMASNDVVSKEEYTSSLANKKLTYNVVDNAATFDDVDTNGALELISNENVEKIVITGEGLDDDYEITKGASDIETTANVYLVMLTVFQDYSNLQASDFTLNDIIGMNLNVKFVMVDGSVSENGTTEESYTLEVTGTKVAVHTVTFNYDNKTDEVKVKNGNTVDPIDITNSIDEDKFVEGWYTEETLDNKYDFDTEVETDLELYANVVDKCIVHVGFVTDGQASNNEEYNIACGTTFNLNTDKLYIDTDLTQLFNKNTVINTETYLYTPSTANYMNNLVDTKIINNVNSDKYSVSRTDSNINFTLIDGDQLVANTTGTGLVSGMRQIIGDENVTNITITANDKTYVLDNDEINPDTHVSYVQAKLMEIVTDLTGKQFTQVKQSDLIGKSFNLVINNEEFVSLDSENGTAYTVNFAGNGN